MTRIGSSLGLSVGMQALLDRIRRDGEQLFGAPLVALEPLTFQVRESSEVTRARVVTSTDVRHVFAKLLTPRRPGEIGVAETQARLRHDFDVTRHVFNAMRSTADLLAVEPLACYDDLPGVVTMEAPGTPLDAVIAKVARWPAGTARLGELEATLARVGRWVAVFQRVAPDQAPSRVDLDSTRDYIDARLQKLTRIPRAHFGEVDRRAILDGFDRRARDVRTADLPEAPVHGDITPSNIVVAPHRVTVLDFAMTGRGSKYLDIARLYTQLAFYTAKPQYRPHVIQRLQRATLSGFDPQLSPENPLFEICTVQHVVCHLLSHARQPGSFPRNLYSGHQTRLHRRWLLENSHGAAAGHRVPRTEAAPEPR